eukprot:gene17038-biopygen14373
MAAPQAPPKWKQKECSVAAFHRPRGGQGEATACASRTENIQEVDAFRSRPGSVPRVCPASFLAAVPCLLRRFEGVVGMVPQVAQ